MNTGQFEAFSGISLLNFTRRFKTEEDCKSYLFHLKFSKGFHCSKCSNTTAYKGSKPYTMVCKSCRHTESSTSNTLFHKVKFGLVKAFHIIYDMTTSTNGISANHASKKYEIKYDNIWLFMKKVRVAMTSSTNHPLTGKVYVDEYVIGGYEKGAVGRKADSSKIKVVMAVETTDKNRIKRAYNIKISDYSSDELKVIFDRHISKESSVMTDKWKGYIPLSNEWNIIQDKKYKKNSPVNRMIQQLKSWLRGTHHWVSDFHCVTYLNEFSFRLNRSQWKDSIFHKCVERMVDSEKKNRLQLSRVECMSRDGFITNVNLWRMSGAGFEVKSGKVKMVA